MFNVRKREREENDRKEREYKKKMVSLIYLRFVNAMLDEHDRYIFTDIDDIVSIV